MRRRDFVTLGSTAAAWSLTARAQQKRVPRLCFLTFDPGSLRSTRFEAFFQSLRDLGYLDGQTITIDYLSADGLGERFPTLAAECMRLKADVIVVSTTEAAEIAKKATDTIPIVAIGLGDLVRTGLVSSLAQPGGNVTGMSLMFPELAVKRLNLLTQAVPGISRVLVLSYLTDPIGPIQVTALTDAARSVGVSLQIQDIKAASDLPGAFDAGVKEGAQGVLTTSESIFVVNRARVTELAALHRLPAIYHNPLAVIDAGGLMAYAGDVSDVYRRAATYVDLILKGAKPSDLPVQQPTRFEFVINLKTATMLGLTIPPGLLAIADRVIE
jgi:putative tryptophan/tyrosine transport system substrate-binding protein